MKKRLLSFLLALCIALSLLPITVFAAEAASGTCGDNLSWTLDAGGTLTISGTGAMYNYGYDLVTSGTYAPWRSQVTAITAIVIGNGVTSIGDFAFYNCNRLTNVTIPNSVTSIGENAFSICINLTNVTIPDSVTSIGKNAFSSCGLTSVTVPDGVISIGIQAFQYCNSLTSVKISSSVTSIGMEAFHECSRLTNIGVASGNPAYSSIDGVLFNADQTLLHTYPGGKNDSSYDIPVSVTSIGDCAFAACNNLTNVTIPNSVTSIGDSAFNSCSNLTSVTIPDSVTSFGNSVFIWCYNLTDVTIGAGVTRIGIGAFFGCNGLTSVTIPSSVTKIRATAFLHCTKLTDVYYSGTETEWKAISVDKDNTELTNATIHYNIADPYEDYYCYIQVLDATTFQPVDGAKIVDESSGSRIAYTLNDGTARIVQTYAKFVSSAQLVVSKNGYKSFAFAYKDLEIADLFSPTPTNIIYLMPSDAAADDDFEQKAYVQQHVAFIQSKLPSLHTSDGFYNNVWQYEDGERLWACKTWDVIGDLGQVASLKFGDLSIWVDYYDLFLSDLILDLTENELNDRLLTKATGTYRKVYSEATSNLAVQIAVIVDGDKLHQKALEELFNEYKILSLNKSIGNQGMTEKSRNLVFISLKGTHKRVCFVTNI